MRSGLTRRNHHLSAVDKSVVLKIRNKIVPNIVSDLIPNSEKFGIGNENQRICSCSGASGRSQFFIPNPNSEVVLKLSFLIFLKNREQLKNEILYTVLN